MMNDAFDQIISSDAKTRSGLYTTTAQRLGTTPQNVEKDFWVCWTLDALFNGLIDRPRLLFKGGTSLSKGFGLISRFSEDIDITVFRDDLGKAATVAELEALSGKKRAKALDAIKTACEEYINGPCLEGLSEIIVKMAERNKMGSARLAVETDAEDSQALYLRYPTVTTEDSYITKAVKIESGAKSALDPNAEAIIKPYLEADIPDINLSIGNITTVDPQRTFWDKVVILHGLRAWFDHRGLLRGSGQRVSRHYYDLYQLLSSDIGQRASMNSEMGVDCVAHARMFFNRPHFDLVTAKKGTFALAPRGKMLELVQRDYIAMSGMIFGGIPSFDEIVDRIGELETYLNSSAE